MSKIASVLRVPFDVVSMTEAVSRIMKFLKDGGQHIICTPNPEIVMEAQIDKELMEIFHAADMVVADGVGVVWASKYSENKIKERVSGYDLALAVFDEIKETDYTVYFFGGAPGVANAAAKRMIRHYPGLKIVGTHNGYFDEKEEKKLIDEIKRLSPSILLVGLGSPKQEKWIYENMRFLGAKVCIGVGGSFDVMADKIKRAPKIFRKLGLEWAYRLIKQPSRAKRMLRIPKFVIKVLKTHFMGSKVK